MLIKICGLQTIEHARGAALAGADMLGFVFAPSRRQVDVATVAAIAAALRADSATSAATLVGVFVNASASTMNTALSTCGLDYAQLSGNEPIAIVDQLCRPAIKALRLDSSTAEQEWLTTSPETLLLVDAHVPGSYGGAGVIANWDGAAALARQRRVLLAGGLHPANVAEAIAYVTPFGVDVSSGVEMNGVKDLSRIQAFISAARAAQPLLNIHL